MEAGRRLITLVGPGGVGKTRLLLEIGVRYRDRRPIEYGELGAVTAADEAELAETVASSLGLEVSRRGAVRSLVAALAEDAWLLLVDEAEVVADALGPLAISVLEGNPRPRSWCPRAVRWAFRANWSGRWSRSTSRPPTPTR